MCCDYLKRTFRISCQVFKQVKPKTTASTIVFLGKYKPLCNFLVILTAQETAEQLLLELLNVTRAVY